MKHTFFILICLLCCFSCGAQVAIPDTVQTYSTEFAAVQGYTKSAARYRDQSGQSRAVVADAAGNVFVVGYSCKRGYFRRPMESAAVAGTD